MAPVKYICVLGMKEEKKSNLSSGQQMKQSISRDLFLRASFNGWERVTDKELRPQGRVGRPFAYFEIIHCKFPQNQECEKVL